MKTHAIKLLALVLTMVMLVDISSSKLEFNAFVADMKKLGEEIGVDIYAQHEDIFNSMHKI